ncbi:MAG TPA: hypothetical protein VGL94_07435 [Ktedonobacteraceae bacterium]
MEGINPHRVNDQQKTPASRPFTYERMYHVGSEGPIGQHLTYERMYHVGSEWARNQQDIMDVVSSTRAFGTPGHQAESENLPGKAIPRDQKVLKSAFKDTREQKIKNVHFEESTFQTAPEKADPSRERHTVRHTGIVDFHKWPVRKEVIRPEEAHRDFVYRVRAEKEAEEARSRAEFESYEKKHEENFLAYRARSQEKEALAFAELNSRVDFLYFQLNAALSDDPDNPKFVKIHSDLEGLCSDATHNLNSSRSAEHTFLQKNEEEFSRILAVPFPYSNNSEELHRIRKGMRAIMRNANDRCLKIIHNVISFCKQYQEK